MWIYCCLSVPSVRYVPTAALLANIVYLVIYEQESSFLKLVVFNLTLWFYLRYFCQSDYTIL